MKWNSEKVVKPVFGGLAFASLVFLLGIILILFQQGLPIFRIVNLFEFIGGKAWYPTAEPAEFGILPLILGTLWITLGAMLFCIPVGIGSALFLHEIAGFRLRSILKPIIEILAGIPSIVYGFFGMVIIAPFLQNLLDIPIGQCALTASLILGVMAVPTVCSLAEDALNFVPKSFREASYALGANRWQTLTRVIIPAAGSGISTAIILGMSRVVGETMTVLMVAGGAAVIPKSYLDPVRPMTATIAAEMGEAVVGSPHYHALFAIGLVLFLITMAFNIIAEIISRNYRLKLGLGR
ncbi:MAG: phosphate ABC transporter permease subunit PstC [Candidatus Marinimicrobia bacterium]|jgi:phosphate transport system permease protein|nr:phosphate ABC transporter permease subunit PstC [Candidatus Neomarinimicrobiota bacterium]OQC47979.1 MAG: Phosphate transport system permease protein PstC [Candidatus Marinimicrobia bacterium ADurb.Bin030]MBP9005763.1 phosphate ABC transporter permease subunit PstC [Candidatus Neomarinimicrobiota bacterium]HNZ37217.1 phosphate ABC transporter permease subunit PstC [Candidatus Neomarinimicrobiota bacterium]HOG75734.1 phosphate ABC transporter permease subunit PstC [Candidatus Neomarinimicrobi